MDSECECSRRLDLKTPPEPRGLGPRGPSEPRGLEPRGLVLHIVKAVIRHHGCPNWPHLIQIVDFAAERTARRAHCLPCENVAQPMWSHRRKCRYIATLVIKSNLRSAKLDSKIHRSSSTARGRSHTPRMSNADTFDRHSRARNANSCIFTA